MITKGDSIWIRPVFQNNSSSKEVTYSLLKFLCPYNTNDVSEYLYFQEKNDMRMYN